eukprot:CAMPEP_0117576480 /NCGR_PEP_ID=MMETSP0784-20121206/62824_1 /TAXON_ID=39447 /ORGANISM="" /LENGTH=812 /DNA_ID=CAMNT_0005375743 /DNA_START=68 /DNA_END=2506 /DNA_ORIENTATION=+
MVATPGGLSAGGAAHGSVGRSTAGDGPLPDWMVDCDLGVCEVLQDTSAQIVAKCRTFSEQLGGVCGRAIEQLPHGKHNTNAGVGPDSSDPSLGFLSAFGTLSHALLQLACDLENTMTLPLQSVIATLTEESNGRVKHWRQVRNRLIELQERYGKSRQRSLEVHKKLAASGAGWFGKSTKAASEQHAAMRELARCEEELVESEASLRRLEDESRERLRQLHREKDVLLQGVLSQGTGSLRQLLLVADKAPAPVLNADAMQHGESWQGVMPQEGGVRDSAERSTTTECGIQARLLVPTEPGSPPAPSEVVPADPGIADLARKEAADIGDAACVDPSSKYLEMGCVDSRIAELQELAELGALSDEEDDSATMRSVNWSPATSQTPSSHAADGSMMRLGSGGGARRTLVFQSSSPLLVSMPGVGGTSTSLSAGAVAASSVTASAGSNTGGSLLSGARPNPLLHRVAAAAASAMDQPRSRDFGGAPRQTKPRLETDNSAPEAGEPTSSLRPQRSFFSEGPAGLATASTSPWVASRQKAIASSTNASSRTAVQESEDEDGDELNRYTQVSLETLETAEVELEVSPLVAEDPRKCFERYVRRLPERVASVTETVWERLQARAVETPLGGHVGKLEFFWILSPGSKASPESAQGLVCFQFVQGFAANFARILHLSVVDSDECHEAWHGVLPSAILEVRRFLLATLPVNSLRATVIAGEDEEGRIYMDGDVEVAYQRCSFRWFQLTQSMRRTRSTLTRWKIKKSSRFLVLHTSRRDNDPPAPRGNRIACMPALMLQSQGSIDTGSKGVDCSDAPLDKFSSF